MFVLNYNSSFYFYFFSPYCDGIWKRIFSPCDMLWKWIRSVLLFTSCSESLWLSDIIFKGFSFPYILRNVQPLENQVDELHFWCVSSRLTLTPSVFKLLTNLIVNYNFGLAYILSLTNFSTSWLIQFCKSNSAIKTLQD